MFGKDKKNILNYVLVFILGVLLACNIFTIIQYQKLSKDSDNMRSDIVTIIQAYNNLVTTLQQQGIGPKPTTK